MAIFNILDASEDKIIDVHEILQIFHKIPDRTLLKFEFLL